MLILLLTSLFAAAPVEPTAKGPPPVWLAQSDVRIREFRPPGTNPVRERSGIATFFQSNAVWEVEIEYLHPEKNSVRLENSKKIPDGIRSYLLFEADTRAALTVGNACPLEHPTAPALFGVWLAFSFNPSLPFLDDKRMRRILDLPGCHTALYNSRENEGSYRIQYLGAGKGFVSSLQITNNGFVLDLDVTADGVKEKVSNLGRSFLEFNHQLLAVTNIAGHPFPAHILQKQYGSWWADGAYQPALLREVEITLQHLELNPGNIHRPKPLPRLYAQDGRPEGTDWEHPVSYIVTNDTWKPLSHPEMIARTKTLRPQQQE